jgi:hypothetical protein
VRGRDGVWKKPDEAVADENVVRAANAEMLKEVKLHEQAVRAKKAAARKEQRREKQLLSNYDPFKPVLQSHVAHGSLENEVASPNIDSTRGFSPALKPEDRTKVLPPHTLVHKQMRDPGRRYDFVGDAGGSGKGYSTEPNANPKAHERRRRHKGVKGMHNVGGKPLVFGEREPATIARNDGKRRPVATKDSPIEGHSLVNLMGGGAGNGGGNGVATHARIFDEEYKREERAQADGMSHWGTAGGGAPRRTRSGQVNAKLASVVEGNLTGATEEKKEPGYRARRDQVRKDQETHMQQKSRTKHLREAKARAETEAIAAQPQLTDRLEGNTHWPRASQRAGVTPMSFEPSGRPPKRLSEHERGKVRGKELLREHAQRTATEQTRKALAIVADRAHIATVQARRDLERSRAKGQAAVPMRKYDPTLGDKVRPEYASRASPAAQRALGRELDKAIESREEARKSNKMRRLRDDAVHAANANRFFEATAPTFVRQANGEPTARRHLPTGEGACDYRVLAMAADNLM